MTLGLFLEVYQYLPNVGEKRGEGGGERRGGREKEKEKKSACRNQ